MLKHHHGENGTKDDSDDENGLNGHASSDDEDENEWMLIKQEARAANLAEPGSSDEE